MPSVEEITKYLERSLSRVRLEHTMGVARLAEALAARWGTDEEATFLAGLVHDCAKEIPPEKALKLLKERGYIPDEIELKAPALLHAPLGAYLAEEYFGISDPELLNAVRYHTTGRANMTLLEKIVYVADFSESGRRYKEAELVRKLAFEALDDAVLEETGMVIKFTVDRGGLLHPNTIEARNGLLADLKGFSAVREAGTA